MVEISGFDRSKKHAVIETKGGKVRVTFTEWKQIAAAYKELVENAGLQKR